jgi:hypothetical protein
MSTTLIIVIGILAVSVVGLTATVLSTRSTIARVITAVLALGFAALCGFGYLASFEVSESPFGPWQLVYGTGGIFSLGAFVVLLLSALRGGKTSTASPN